MGSDLLACQVQDGILVAVGAVADDVVIAVALFEGHGIIALAVFIVVAGLIAGTCALVNPRNRVEDIVVPAGIVIPRLRTLHRHKSCRLVVSRPVRYGLRLLYG